MIIPDWPAPGNIVAASTTRRGGVSRGCYESLNIATHVDDDPDCVAENRRRLAAQWQLPAEPRWLQQVHSDRVVIADQVSGLPSADAAYTDRPGVVCVVQSADCLPVLFCDRRGGQVAAAHAGWSGLVAGVLERTLEHFDSETEVMAWIGPAISQPCFEVGPEVRERYLQAATVTARDATAAAFIPSQRRGHWMADLCELARIRLQPLGVAVYGGDHCTVSDPEQFFSYRRDGVTGRIASLIYIKS